MMREYDDAVEAGKIAVERYADYANAQRWLAISLAQSGRTDIRLVYERGGTIHHLDNAESDPELSTLSLFARKFLLLRAIPDTHRGYCMW